MSIETRSSRGIPLSLRLALQLEQASDLLDPDCEPGEPGIPTVVFDHLATARAAVAAALAALRPVVDTLTDADRAAAGETLSQQNRSTDPDLDYDL